MKLVLKMKPPGLEPCTFCTSDYASTTTQHQNNEIFKLEDLLLVLMKVKNTKKIIQYIC